MTPDLEYIEDIPCKVKQPYGAVKKEKSASRPPQQNIVSKKSESPAKVEYIIKLRLSLNVQW